MSLLGSLVGFFICKTLLDLPFFYKKWAALLQVMFYSSLLVVPLITILYHETSTDFWFVYVGMIVADVVICYQLLQPHIVKAMLASFISNTIAMLFFYIGNG